LSAEALRLGLVGCGRLAELGYLPALDLVGAVRLVAVADPDRIRRERVAGHAGPGVRALRDAEALLAAVPVDALVLASPTAAHVADAAAAAEAGVTVLVEKPPAPDADGAAGLAALTPTPWVAFNRRFDPGARAARDAVPATGTLDLRLAISYRRRSWGAHAVHDDALTDLGPHLVDWARWLTGSEVHEVTSATASHERASMTLALGRGTARIDAAADRLHRERIEVRDAAGTVVARHAVGGPVAAVTGRLVAGPHPLVTSLAGQLEALVDAVAGRPSPHLGTAADGLATMQVLDAARTSAATGRPTPVPSPQEP
jgi:predicted dehydrogenase